MNTKNLMSRSVKGVNRSILQNLPIDLVELSEKDLKRVVGAGDPCGGGMTSKTTTTRGGTTTTTTTYLPCICRPEAPLILQNDFLTKNDFLTYLRP
jgi:hypothetical protein